MTASAAFLTALRQEVGADGVLTEDDDLAYYGTDRCRGPWSVRPSVVVLPKTIEHVQAVVRLCAEHGLPIVPSGGRTGLAGAATATNGELVLSLERMAAILGVDASSMTLRCQAGTTIQAVHDAAAGVGLAYPVDWAAKGTAQVGGSIGTNAGGVKVIRYGPTRNWVAAVKVVLADGSVVETGGPLTKDNTGYDLKDLFVGSEGTLGVVVEATLRLCRPPAGRVVALCAALDVESVLELFERVRASGLTLRAFECFDQQGLARVLEHRSAQGRGPFEDPSPQHALIEVEVTTKGDDARIVDVLMEQLADAQEAGEIADAVLAQTPQQAKDLWSLREDISESLHRHRPHKADITLRLSQMAGFLSSWWERKREHLPDVEAVVFGHIGDGNVHLNLLQPPDADPEEFRARCKAFDQHTYGLVGEAGGSISAEHGIGLLKRDHLHHSRNAGEIEMMRTVKRALDPNGLFNPGKIF